MRAAKFMSDNKVDRIITMGGDGTNRVVARTCGQVPIMPISTGTNNTFPFMVEGTTAGLAAGILARKIVTPDKCVKTAKKLNIIKNGKAVDLALIDAVVLEQQFIGAKAIWDIPQVKEVIATQCHPSYVGMASIGGSFYPGRIHGKYLHREGRRFFASRSSFPWRFAFQLLLHHHPGSLFLVSSGVRRFCFLWTSFLIFPH